MLLPKAELKTSALDVSKRKDFIGLGQEGCKCVIWYANRLDFRN